MAEAAKQLRDVDAVFAALAHATRRHILLVIQFRGGQMSAGAIAARFECSWPTVSRHLRVLEDAGLLAHEKDGRTRNYSINKARLEVAKDWLAWFDEPSGTA